MYTKFHENILKGIRVMERTQKVNGRIDGQTDRRTDGQRARHNTTVFDGRIKVVKNYLSIISKSHASLQSIQKKFAKFQNDS